MAEQSVTPMKARSFIGTNPGGGRAISNQFPPPVPLAVLYDGNCRFCCAGARRLAKWARPGSLRMINFQEPGALNEFPALDHATCMRQMLLLTPEGKTYGGAEAIVQALTTRGGITGLAFLYYVPGIRQLSNLLYWCVARIRYFILGKVDPCKDGACRI